MKRFFKILFPLILLVYSNTIISSCCPIGCCEKFCEMEWDTACQDCCSTGRPFFTVRPQHWNLARTTVGWQPMAYEYEKDKWSAAFAITPEYTRSLKPLRVAKYFFGDDLQECGRLLISGSRKGYPNYEARTEHEWLADYFGLPTDFQSIVRFAPRAYNFITDLNVHLAMDGFREGMFLDITAPVVYASRAMNMCETFTDCGTESGVLGFDPGYMGEKEIGRNSLAADFTAAMSGTYMWGDLVEPLQYGKISTRKRSVLRLADIRIALGCNLMRGDDYQCALMGFIGIPTGNVPCGEYLFEPIAGNGGHFELGIGSNGYMRLWEDNTEERAISLYFDARLAHLFKATQWRSFDLKNNPNSRYMLIQEMKSPSENLYVLTSEDPAVYTAPNHQYNGRLFHLIDKTTCCTDVTIDVQGEFAVTMKYEHSNFAFDLGYNFWGRTGEKFCPGCTLKKDKYALKGDAFIIGFRQSNGDPAPVSATESKATINAGTNTPIETKWNILHTFNKSIDNADHAYYSEVPENIDDYTTSSFQSTSYQPVLLSSDDLETCNTPSAISHKIFGHLNYAWTERESGNIPFLGVGGEIEFAGKMCESYSTLSQWGIWVKGGIEFE